MALKLTEEQVRNEIERLKCSQKQWVEVSHQKFRTLLDDWLALRKENAELWEAWAGMPCQDPQRWHICTAAGDKQDSNGYCYDCGKCWSCKARAKVKEDKK